MNKLDMLYEGKAKKVYLTDMENSYIIEYKDDATAFNGLKKGQIHGKGVINNKISNHFFKLLESKGIATHFEQEISDIESVVKKVTILPIEVIVRNIAAGSLCKRLGFEEGVKLSPTVLEFCYKDDSLGDPLINEYHAYALKLAEKEDIEKISKMSFEINQILSEYLKDLGIELIDFKLEFGRDCDGNIILADEISPDTCRFWDSKTRKKLDKDRFRMDLGQVEEAYKEILGRLMQ